MVTAVGTSAPRSIPLGTSIMCLKLLSSVRKKMKFSKMQIRQCTIQLSRSYSDHLKLFSTLRDFSLTERACSVLFAGEEK